MAATMAGKRMVVYFMMSYEEGLDMILIKKIARAGQQ
jgi:hypothetical protein